MPATIRTLPHWRGHLAYAVLGGLLLMSVISTPALAEGGTSIASAPVVQYGQQAFGNLSQGPEDESSHCITVYRSWWTMPVMAGDLITVDWEAQDRTDRLELFPSGTTDFTFPQTNSATTSSLNDNAKAELTYTAPRTSSLPLEFHRDGYPCNMAPGPYSFTAYVVHSVRLFIAHRGRLSLSGTMTVGVHTPVGEPITDPNLQIALEIKSRGHWYTVGNATAVNGIATVPFRLSARLRRQHISVRAIAYGSAYRSASSAAIRVRVG
jgi:hypothetical protein